MKQKLEMSFIVTFLHNIRRNDTKTWQRRTTQPQGVPARDHRQVHTIHPSQRVLFYQGLLLRHAAGPRGLHDLRRVNDAACEDECQVIWTDSAIF